MLHDAYLMNESFVFYHSSSSAAGAFSPQDSTSLNTSTDDEISSSATEPQAQVLHKSSSSSSSSWSSSSSRLNERWQEFCDNLSFSIRSKLFIMESNFKHRLRATRKYLLKRLPPNWAPANNKQSVETTTTTKRQFRFPEPNSAKSLGVQQECLLARLKRIKSEMRTVRSASYEGEGPQIDYIDQDQEQLDDDDDDVELGTGGRPMFESAAAAAVVSEESGRGGDEDQVAAANSQPSANCTKRKRRWIARSSRQLKDTFTGSKQKCIVCYERAPNIVTLPCKHSDICSDCFIEIIFLAVKHSQYPLRCVLCRQKVERIRCSRRLLLSVIERKRGRKCAGK